MPGMLLLLREEGIDRTDARRKASLFYSFTYTPFFLFFHFQALPPSRPPALALKPYLTAAGRGDRSDRRKAQGIYILLIYIHTLLSSLPIQALPPALPSSPNPRALPGRSWERRSIGQTSLSSSSTSLSPKHEKGRGEQGMGSTE